MVGERWKHHLFDLLSNNSSFMHFPISISRKYVDRGRLINKQIQKFNTRWEFVKVEEKNYKFWNVLNLRGWSNRKTNRKVCIKHNRNNLTHSLYLSLKKKLSESQGQMGSRSEQGNNKAVPLTLCWPFFQLKVESYLIELSALTSVLTKLSIASI